MSLNGHWKIHRRVLSFCFLFMICWWDTVTWASSAEMCEDEGMTNLEYCPIRPGINTNFLDLHKHAYLVCEDDILPACSETIFLNDKKQAISISPSGTPTNSTNTTMDSAPSTTETAQNTTSKEKCMSCEEICEEHKTRCDFSEFIQKSRSTFDGVLKVREEMDTTRSKEVLTTNEEMTTTRGHGLNVTISQNRQQLKDNLQKNRYNSDSYPKVYFDVFFPKERQKHKTDKIETILDQFNYKSDGRHRRFRRLPRKNGVGGRND